MYENLTKMMVKFEKDQMTDENELQEFFQRLVDKGINVNNNGHYTQKINKLIRAGKISKDPRPKSVSWLKGLMSENKKS